MNFLSNTPSLTESQEGKASWDWNAWRRDETPPERAVRTQGQKRHADGLSLGAADDRIKRARLNQGSRPFTQTAMTRNPRSTMTRSPLVSSSRPPRTPFTEEEEDIKPKIPRPKANGPWLILSDDESDEDAVPVVETKPLPPAPQQRYDLNRNHTNLSEQRVLSEQKRAEAKRRKEESCGLRSTFGRFEVSNLSNIQHEKPSAGVMHGFVNHGGNGDSVQTSPPAEGSSMHRRDISARPPSTPSFHPRLPVSNRTSFAPSHPPAVRSKVVDLTDDASDDDLPKATQPSSIHHFGQQEHQDWLAPCRERDSLQQAQAKARERAERKKQASEREEAERRKALEADREKKLVQEKQKERQKQLAEEAERNSKPQERYDLAPPQQENNSRLLLEEEERRRQRQEQLRQHNERQEALRREKARQDERALAKQRELDRELAEKREMDEKMAEFHRAKADAEREEAEREEAEREEAEREEAENRIMEARMADFNKRKADAERRQAEKKRLEDQQRQQEEEQGRFERERRKQQAPNPLTDREREELRRREERIAKQQRRNALNREHDNDDDDSDTDVPLAHQHRVRQPMSLSDLARRSETHQTRPRRDAPLPHQASFSDRAGTGLISDPSDPSTIDDKPKRIKFAEIVEEHAKLLKWRSRHFSLSWDAVAMNFEKRLSKKTSKDHLRHRHGDLMALLRQAGVDSDLDTMEDLYACDKETLRRVNRLVDPFRVTPLYPETKQERRQQEQAAAQRVEMQTQTQTPGPLASLVPKAKPHSANTFGNFTGLGARTGLKVPQVTSTSRPGPGPGPAPSPTLPPERPTTGGKTIDQNFVDYHFHIQQMNYEERERKAEEAQAPHKLGDDPTDFIYNIYRIYRREWSFDDIERCEYEGEEEPEWWECPGEFEDVGEANTAASKEVMRSIPNRPVYAGDEGKLEWDYDRDHMVKYTMENEDVGLLEVRVARQLRTYEERILPKTDLHKKPRTMYVVKQRTIKKAADDVLGTSELQDHESILPDGLHTSLDQANDMAATHFVTQTFKSNSANLHLRDVEKYEEIARILDSLPQLGLVHLKTDEDDGDVTEVWVETNRHQGPVN